MTVMTSWVCPETNFCHGYALSWVCPVMGMPTPGLGFMEFGRFEGLAKSAEKILIEWTGNGHDLGYDSQEGYGHFDAKKFL